MSLFAVDPAKCQRDGVCVDECPRFLVEMEDQDSVPTPIEGADQLCINCGHCVAVCPRGALSLKTMTPDDCPSVRADLLPSAEQVDHFLRTRRSIRTFEDRVVPREVIARLIDVARYAPSGSNRQPVEWLVVYDSQEVRRLARLVEEWLRHTTREQPQSSTPSYASTLARASEKRLDLTCRGAPHVVLAHAPKGLEANGVIALTYLELAAYSLGVGACWAGFLNGAAQNWPPMQEALGLPRGHVSCGALLVGYPTYRYRRVPLRNEPRIAWR